MAYKCSICGVESEIEQAFTKGGFGANREYYCPTCQEKRTTDEFTVSLVWYFLAGLIGIVFWVVKPASLQAKILLGIFSMLTFLPPLIVFHEMAHAITARILGLRVFAVYLGYGKVLHNTYLGKILVVVRSLPLGGASIISAPMLSFYHLRFGLTHLAGPLLHAMILLGMGSVWLRLSKAGGSESSLILLFLTFWLIANLVLLVFNLIPRRVDTPYGKTKTDGGHILSDLFPKPKNMEDSLTGYYIMEAMEAARQGRLAGAERWIEQGLEKFPANPLVLSTAGYVLFQAGQMDRARQIWLSQLEDAENLEPIVKCMAMNNIAFADLIIYDPALLDEADRCSAEAYKNLSWDDSIRGTRGSVLVELGQAEEGLELLRTSLEKTDTPKDKASTMCYIAIGEARRGNQAEAQRYVQAARLLDPQCVFLGRASREAGMERDLQK